VEVRDELLQASRALYDRARSGDWKGIYDGAAAEVREKQSEGDFTEPLARVFREIGVPERLEVSQTAVVRFGASYPHRAEVTCSAGGNDLSPTFLLDETPVQASLVESAELQGDLFYFSTLWHRDGGRWRLAGFFVKPQTLLGRSSAAYERAAGEERELGNERNAALLYNVAIDLAVPNAWTRPGEVDALQRKQRRLSVEQLPVGQVEEWPAGPDTFRVRSVAYGVLPSGLAVIVRYIAQGSLADTTALVPYADRLHRYMVAAFPEYPRVFRTLALEASDPADTRRTWTRVYPLGK
jgi:hypothetical protein